MTKQKSPKLNLSHNEMKTPELNVSAANKNKRKRPYAGILKSSPSPERRSEEERFLSPRVMFADITKPPSLAKVIERFDQSGHSDPSELSNFIIQMKKQPSIGLLAWIQELSDNISLLRPDMEHFVVGILNLNFYIEETVVVISFRNFLSNLIIANVFYIKPVVKRLVKNFYGKPVKPTEDLESEEFQESERVMFDHIHNTILCLMKVSPWAVKERLLRCCKQNMPYYLCNEERKHTNYVKNLTRVLGYLDQSHDRIRILKVVMHRLVELDAHLPRILDYPDSESSEDDDDDKEEKEEEVFQMEIQEEQEKPSNQTKEEKESQRARLNLDKAMVAMFEYIERHPDMKVLYQDLEPVFDSYILPSYMTGHVQFLMFYILGRDYELTKKRKRLSKSFIEFLFAKFRDPNTPSINRQSTVSYIASFVTRAKFVNVDMTMKVLQSLTEWIHSYQDTRDDTNNTSLKTHAAYYAACQSTFYIFAFLHRDFEREQRMDFVASLNLSKIITGRLNPLRVCLPNIAAQFSAITNHYQIAYCNSIMEKNARLNLPIVGHVSSGDRMEQPILLDDFFPFDPYELSESKCYITTFYREYSGSLIELNDPKPVNDLDAELLEMEVEEEEEEGNGNRSNPFHLASMACDLESPRAKKRHGSNDSFSYGTSPGFKHQ